MEEPTKQSIPLPYGEVEALQPYFQQLEDHYQLLMNDNINNRYRVLEVPIRKENPRNV